MGRLLLLLPPLLLLRAASVLAACSRQSLVETNEEFFKAGAANNTAGVKQAPNATIALNNKAISGLANSPFADLKGFTNFTVAAVDVEKCQIATLRVAQSQVLSTRLKIDQKGALTEVEFLQAFKGDHQFFNPPGFPSSAPTLWSKNQTAASPPAIPSTWSPISGSPAKDVDTAKCKNHTGAARSLTRRELMYIAATYADGLKGEPWASCVPGGVPCVRNENGVVTSQNCTVGLAPFNFLTRGRRWVVDTETAVVLGTFYFDRNNIPPMTDPNLGPGAPVESPDRGNSTKLFLHEYFKVEAGALAAIFAAMKYIPASQASAVTFAGEQ